MTEKTVRRVQQICEKNVQRIEVQGLNEHVGMEKQMNERTVRIVRKMYENVQHIVGTERQRQQKIVGIVRKMYENVVQYVETVEWKIEKIGIIVGRMWIIQGV